MQIILTCFTNYYVFSAFKTENTSEKHHEESSSFQRKFKEDVIKMQTAFEDACNPFLDRSPELINIKTKDIMPDDVVASLRSLEEVGLCLYREHHQVLSGKLPITQPIKMNGFFLFAAKKKRVQAKIAHKMELLNYNLNTMGKLFLTSQARGISPEEMFSYENHQDPPSLAFAGELNDGDKSAMLDILTEDVPNVPEIPDTVRLQLIDGPALVHMIKPDPGSTFDQYSDKIYNYLDGRLKKVNVLYRFIFRTK